MMTERQIRALINQAKETPFYKELLIPELDRRLASYDELMANADPWRRYGYVEAYLALKSFKLALELASSDEEEENKADTREGGPARIKGENYG